MAQCNRRKETHLLILFLQQRAELIDPAHHATLLIVHGLYKGIPHVRHQEAEAEERVSLGSARHLHQLCFRNVAVKTKKEKHEHAYLKHLENVCKTVSLPKDIHNLQTLSSMLQQEKNTQI